MIMKERQQAKTVSGVLDVQQFHLIDALRCSAPAFGESDRG